MRTASCGSRRCMVLHATALRDEWRIARPPSAGEASCSDDGTCVHAYIWRIRRIRIEDFRSSSRECLARGRDLRTSRTSCSFEVHSPTLRASRPSPTHRHFVPTFPDVRSGKFAVYCARNRRIHPEAEPDASARLPRPRARVRSIPRRSTVHAIHARKPDRGTCLCRTGVSATYLRPIEIFPPPKHGRKIFWREGRNGGGGCGGKSDPLIRPRGRWPRSGSVDRRGTIRSFDTLVDRKDRPVFTVFLRSFVQRPSEERILQDGLRDPLHDPTARDRDQTPKSSRSFGFIRCHALKDIESRCGGVGVSAVRRRQNRTMMDVMKLLGARLCASLAILLVLVGLARGDASWKLCGACASDQ